MSRTIRTVPAILTDDPIALGQLVFQTEKFTDFAQFDIMDGQFVPSTSVSCEDIASLRTKLTWEAHLMVVHPERCLEDFQRAGAQKIVFHAEATPYPEMIIQKIRELDMLVGLAVNPRTTIEEIAPYVDALDSVLFLSVNPGYYGAAFIPEVLDKVKAFRKKYPRMEIGLDGGVNKDTIPPIAESGVDVIYIGSAVFKQPDPGDAYRRLTSLANTYAV
ncbi:MAG: ribulose-phosphate 3-epimerase [Dehalococcoidales bacterium]|nr:ribulose-phosphate 3-epimerase [Dehalococcoidales bacterium]